MTIPFTVPIVNGTALLKLGLPVIVPWLLDPCVKTILVMGVVPSEAYMVPDILPLHRDVPDMVSVEVVGVDEE